MFLRDVAKTLAGLNAASLVRGLRLGPRQMILAGQKSCTAARGLESADLSSLPEVDVIDVLGDRKPSIQLRVQRYEDGILPVPDAIALLSICVAEGPREVLEIGTYMGHTTRALAENLPGARVHTVDLPQGYSPETDPASPLPKDDFHLIAKRVVGREYRGQACEGRIVQHFADTGSWDFREAGRPTLFFIDGAHTYEYCRRDTEQCFELCAGRGVFFWHDCDDLHSGVVRFLNEWRSKARDIVRFRGTSLAYWKSA